MAAKKQPQSTPAGQPAPLVQPVKIPQKGIYDAPSSTNVNFPHQNTTPDNKSRRS